jgi:teichuronic acid biosynthesis glycosyltransferase TuaH
MLEISENHIMKNSDVIFATSEFLKERISSRTNNDVFLVENGIEFDKFYSTKKSHYLNNIPSPKIGYVGGLKPKINFKLLQKIACERPDWNLVIIGPKPNSNIKDLYELVANYNNVYWIKGIDKDIVPAYMKELDVGLLPYKQIEYNKAVFPLKFFEYMGSGLPVVGCGLPSTEKYNNKGIYAHTIDDYHVFIDACEKALSCTDV